MVVDITGVLQARAALDLRDEPTVQPLSVFRLRGRIVVGMRGPRHLTERRRRDVGNLIINKLAISKHDKISDAASTTGWLLRVQCHL